MGSASARDMILQADRDTALSWHLTSNHYPPLPTSLIEPCKKAIEAAREAIFEDNDAKWAEEIELPEGVEWKGKNKAPVHAIIEEFHLQDFLPDPDGDEPDEEDCEDT